MIDADGYRPNVGIIVSSAEGQLFWARRIGQRAWQFPQGGIRAQETPLEAMYRELNEEVGLTREDVAVIGCTRGWLRYRLPKHMIRRHSQPVCIGQKQVWFLLRLTSDEGCVRLDCSQQPEFDAWRWVDYWRPLEEVVFFKRRVYRCALLEFRPLIADDTLCAKAESQTDDGAPSVKANRRPKRRGRARSSSPSSALTD